MKMKRLLEKATILRGTVKFVELRFAPAQPTRLPGEA